jgi:hypothetical protein
LLNGTGFIYEVTDDLIAAKPDSGTSGSTSSGDIALNDVIINESAFAVHEILVGQLECSEAEVIITLAIKRMLFVVTSINGVTFDPDTRWEVIVSVVAGNGNGDVRVRNGHATIPMDPAGERGSGGSTVFADVSRLILSVGTVVHTVTAQVAGNAHARIAAAGEFSITAAIALNVIQPGLEIQNVIVTVVVTTIETVLDGVEPGLEPLQPEAVPVNPLTRPSFLLTSLVVFVLRRGGRGRRAGQATHEERRYTETEEQER